jgi:hypothetical protein
MARRYLTLLHELTPPVYARLSAHLLHVLAPHVFFKRGCERVYLLTGAARVLDSLRAAVSAAAREASEGRARQLGRRH